jgi:drug/metabolite transporter (DMT)-like permease
MPTRPSSPVEGALWMVVSGACFSIMSGLIRPATELLHPLEVVFLRTVLGALMLLPLIIGAPLPSRHAGKVLLGRGVIDAGSMALWFLAIPMLPLATAIALNFTAPLFSVVFAILFLGEVVRARRWAALVIGFAGVLVIQQPGATSFEWASLYVLSGAAMAATARVCARHLSQHIDPRIIVGWHFVIITPVLAIPAAFVWTTPNLEALGWIALIAMVGTFAHYSIAKSVAVAEASQVAPFDYVQLIVAAAIGYFVFAEVPGLTTWIGSAIIAGSATYIARREAQLRRQALAQKP